MPVARKVSGPATLVERPLLQLDGPRLRRLPVQKRRVAGHQALRLIEHPGHFLELQSRPSQAAPPVPSAFLREVNKPLGHGQPQPDVRIGREAWVAAGAALQRLHPPPQIVGFGGNLPINRRLLRLVHLHRLESNVVHPQRLGDAFREHHQLVVIRGRVRGDLERKLLPVKIALGERLASPPARPPADPVGAATFALGPAAHFVGREGAQSRHLLHDARKEVGRVAGLVGELVGVFALVRLRAINLAPGDGPRGHKSPARASLLEAAVDHEIALRRRFGLAKRRARTTKRHYQ